MTEKIKEHPEIAAKFVGPAPNKYFLPSTLGVDPDKTITQGPAYSIRPNNKKMIDHSPGPIYGFNSRMTHRGMSGIPTATMSGRAKMPYLWEGIQDNPGPNQYFQEKVRMKRERTAPAMKFTSRPKSIKKNTPSPCSYTLPSILGDRPINLNTVPFYSMNKRIDYSSYSYDFAKTPGPAGYKVPSMYVNINRPPMYSLKARTVIPKFKMDNPGPGTYDLHSVKMTKRTAPNFSMGIKHSPYIMPLCQDIFQ